MAVFSARQPINASSLLRKLARPDMRSTRAGTSARKHPPVRRRGSIPPPATSAWPTAPGPLARPDIAGARSTGPAVLHLFVLGAPTTLQPMSAKLHPPTPVRIRPMPITHPGIAAKKSLSVHREHTARPTINAFSISRKVARVGIRMPRRGIGVNGVRFVRAGHIM